MFHLALYAGSIAQNADVIVPAVSDQILTIQDQGFLPQHDMDLLFAAALGTTMVHAYLDSPSNGVVTDPFIRPVNLGATFPSSGYVADYRQNPFRVKGIESLTAFAQQGAVGAEVETVVVGLRSESRLPPPGNIFTLRGTSVTAAVANQWSDLSVTWRNNLPAGEYAVVGMEIVGAAAIAGRLILNNQTWRPGCVAGSGVGIQTPQMFRKGGLGLWGHFRSTDMPRVQAYATAATAVWTVYLDFVRLSSGGLR